METPPPEAIVAGMRLYRETGRLPEDPRTASVVQAIVAFLEATDKTIPEK